MITLGIISPSFGPGKYFPLRIQRAIDNAKRLGFQVRFSENALNSNGYVADSAINRAGDLMNMFQDPDIDIIMSMIGGNHSNGILKYIDWGLINKNPKPFIGYSDISVLHFALYTQTKVPTYYGPAFITQFGEYPEPLNYTIEQFRSALSGGIDTFHIIPSTEWTEEFLDWGNEQNTLRPRNKQNNTGWKWLKSGKTEGKILGGCIPSINHCIGTPYWPNLNGIIFFMDIPEGKEESIGLTIADLDSYLTDLDNIGFFDQISGLIVGRPYMYSAEDRKELEDILLYYTQGKRYPILLEFDIGHTDPITTIRLGSKCVLDSSRDYVTIES